MVIRETHVAVPRINRRHIIERERKFVRMFPCGFFLFSSSSRFFLIRLNMSCIINGGIKVQPSIADYCLDSCVYELPNVKWSSTVFPVAAACAKTEVPALGLYFGKNLC